MGKTDFYKSVAANLTHFFISIQGKPIPRRREFIRQKIPRQLVVTEDERPSSEALKQTDLVLYLLQVFSKQIGILPTHLKA